MSLWPKFQSNIQVPIWLKVLAGLVLVAAGVLYSDVPTMFASRYWPAADGVITSRRLIGHRFEEYDGDFYTYYEGYIQYEYKVNGTTYTARTVNALSIPSYPQEISLKYPEGKAVTVFYNPRDPSRAVLEPGLVFSGQAFGLLSAVFCWTGVFLLAQALWYRLTGRRGFLRGWPDDSIEN